MPTSAITNRKQFTLTADITVGDRTYAKGSSPFLSELEQQQLISSFGNDVITEYQKPTTDADYFAKFGMSKAEFEALKPEQKQYLQGLPVITETMYFNKFGVSKNDFLTLPEATRKRLLGIGPKYRYEKIDNGKTIDIHSFRRK